MAKDNGIVYTSKPIFNYRQSIHSITSSGNSYIKMEALEIEERWWNEFIKHKPINDQDQLSLAMIQRSLPIYLKSRKRRTIQKSFFHGKQSGSVFFWFKKRSKYKISIMDIAISYLRFVLRLA